MQNNNSQRKGTDELAGSGGIPAAAVQTPSVGFARVAGWLVVGRLSGVGGETPPLPASQTAIKHLAAFRSFLFHIKESNPCKRKIQLRV